DLFRPNARREDQDYHRRADRRGRGGTSVRLTPPGTVAAGKGNREVRACVPRAMADGGAGVVRGPERCSCHLNEVNSRATQVVITGAGLATCLGLTREATWRGVLQGRCGM